MNKFFVKSLILSILLSLVPKIFIAQEQGDFFIGPLFGINFVSSGGSGIDSVNQYYLDKSKVYVDFDGVNYSGGSQNRNLLNFGLFIDYYFLNNIAFYSSLSYSQKGFIINEVISITTGNDYQFEEEKKINLNYVTLPLLIKHNFQNGIQLFGGYSLNYCEYDAVKSQTTLNYESLDTISGNIINISDNSSYREDYADSFGSDANTLTTGYQFGISYALKRFNFSFRIDNTSSFGKINDNKNNYNRTLQFCIGVNF